MSEIVTTEEDLDADEAKELIELAHQQAVDATEIVDDLLTVSRLERAVMSLQTEPVDLSHEISVTAQRFKGEGTRVVIHASELPTVDADSLRVRQILRNLISNAVRYGGDTLEILAQSN